MPFYENVYPYFRFRPEVPPLTTTTGWQWTLEFIPASNCCLAGISSTMGTTNFISKCLLYVSAVSNLKIFVKISAIVEFEAF